VAAVVIRDDGPLRAIERVDDVGVAAGVLAEAVDHDYGAVRVGNRRDCRVRAVIAGESQVSKFKAQEGVRAL
jgi:hypothetical protein